MILTTVICASVSGLKPQTAQTEIEAMVAKARISNAANDITGALLFTGTHFVQVLEGDAGPIDTLLRKLHADNRHDGLIVTNRASLIKRRFAGWDMAYSGPSQFVAKRVIRIFNNSDPAGQRHATRWLIDLMRQLAQN